jgi:hypothetical protein
MTTHVVTASQEQVDWAIETLDQVIEQLNEEPDEENGLDLEYDGEEIWRAHAVLTAVATSAFGIAEKKETAEERLARVVEGVRELRAYVISHEILIGESTGWNKLKKVAKEVLGDENCEW